MASERAKTSDALSAAFGATIGVADKPDAKGKSADLLAALDSAAPAKPATAARVGALGLGALVDSVREVHDDAVQAREPDRLTAQLSQVVGGGASGGAPKFFDRSAPPRPKAKPRAAAPGGGGDDRRRATGKRKSRGGPSSSTASTKASSSSKSKGGARKKRRKFKPF